MPSVSQLLRKTLEIYRRYFYLIIGYTAWLLIPYLAIVALQLAPITQNAWWHAGVIAISALMGLLWLWVAIIIVKLTAAIAAKHEEINLNNLQASARNLILPVLWVALMQSLAVIGGFLLLIVPGLILTVWFAFAQISVMLDKKHSTQALAFSRSLVRGRFFWSAWLLIGGPLFLLFVFSVVIALLVALVGAVGGVPIETLTATQTPPIWLDAIQVLIHTLIIAPLTLIYTVLLYRVLKRTRHQVA